MPDVQHTNRVPNGYDAQVEGQSSNYHPKASAKVRTWWDLVTSEWRAIFAFLMPILVGGGILLIPASRGQVETVKMEAAANLDVAKTDIQGQIKGVHIELDALKTTVGDMHQDMKEIGRDLKVLLSRSSFARQLDSTPAADAAPASSPPPSPASTEKPKRAVAKRPQKPVAQSSSLLGIFH